MKRIVKFAALVLITLVIALAGAAFAPPPVDAVRPAAAVEPAAAAAAAAVPAAFPYANFGEASTSYSTSFVLVNPTAAAVAVPDYWRPWGFGAGAISVPAKSARRVDAWPAAGGNVAELEVPAELKAYVEIRHGSGLIMRIGELGPATRAAAWYDVRADGEFATYVFIAGEASTAITLRAYNAAGDLVERRGEYLPSGTVAILEAPAGAVRLELESGLDVGMPVPVAGFRAFAYLTHRASNNMIPITRY